jgi:hydrogenase maturation protease
MTQVRTCCSHAGNSLMDKSAFRVLVYGYGNPGRQDDGLGAALVERLEEARLPGVDLECNYQLNIEDADTVSCYDSVIFVDASREGQEPYSFYRIEPASEIAFTTHAMSPEAVLALCQDIYGSSPDAYVLAIPGYKWEMAEGLTEKAAINLDVSYDFVISLLRSRMAEAIARAAGRKKII